MQVLHVTGPKHLNEIQPPSGPVPYVAVPYVDRMDLAYAAADFALCRAGAMTCAELTAVGLPAAYVPLPHGNGEQRLNALPIVQRGGGLLVDDAELTAEWIKTSLLPVLTNIDQVAGMSEAAAAMGSKDADRWLAKAVIDIVAAEAANRVAGTGQPRAGDRPAPRPAADPRTAQPAPAGQWASPASPPPAPAAAEPGSLFSRRPRHQQQARAGRSLPPTTSARPAAGRRSPFPPDQLSARPARGRHTGSGPVGSAAAGPATTAGRRRASPGSPDAAERSGPGTSPAGAVQRRRARGHA